MDPTTSARCEWCSAGGTNECGRVAVHHVKPRWHGGPYQLCEVHAERVVARHGWSVVESDELEAVQP